MIPMMKKDSLAAMIVAGKPKAEGEDTETDYSAGKEAAIADITKAIDTKDATLLASALEDFICMVMDDYESKEDKEDEGEDSSSPVDAMVNNKVK